MENFTPLFQEDEDEKFSLKLSLSAPSKSSTQPSQPQPPPLLVSASPSDIQNVSVPMHPFSSPHQERYLFVPPYLSPLQAHQQPKLEIEVQENSSSSHQRRPRTPPVSAMKQDNNSDTITPPFPWATSKRATIYSLEHLLTQGMRTINGTVQCKQCQQQHDIEFDLREKFYRIAHFIGANKYDMHNRAPDVWMNPMLPNCEQCGQQNSMKPIITKKRAINWLFLFLGQMVGCCTLSQVKYFCKHTRNHRTGAKDRLLYITYVSLCKQLHPEGQYDV